MDKEYLSLFLEEGKEHLQALNNNVLKLEQNMEDLSIISEIFRSAHTFKGMSATMGFKDMADLTHKMENVLDKIRNKQLKVTEKIVEVIFLCIDNLENMTLDIENGGMGSLDVSSTIEILHQIENNGNFDVKSETPKTKITKIGLTYEDYEIQLMKEAIEDGSNIFEILVQLNDDCVLKNARAFMTFNALESLGEVTKCHPSTEELELEDFGFEFKLVFLTNASSEKIKETIEKISEIKNVIIENWKEPEKVNEVKVEVKVEEKASETVINSTEENKTTNQPKSLSIDKSDKTIRVNLLKIENLMNMFEELVIEKGHIEQISKKANNKELLEKVEKLSHISKNLQSVILNMRMVPVEQVFNRFPRMVRDLAKDLNKDIDLIIDGKETEIDRTVIDEIPEPLVHLIRNSLDHGIESSSEREKLGKPRKGTIHLKAFHSGNNVIISVSDDGGGINKEKVLQKAIKNNVIASDKADSLTEQQTYELLFESGFSTAEVISDVSGRGVGLDVVKTTIEKLGGRIHIKSEKGLGTSFVIQLPLTLSIIQCMLIELDKEIFGIPIANIIETMIAKKEDISFVQGRRVFNYRGQIIPLSYLTEICKFGEPDTESKNQRVIVIKNHEKTYAIVVDKFLGQQEIVLKTLGEYFPKYTKNNIFSGATILGDGHVALILDCESLVR